MKHWLFVPAALLLSGCLSYPPPSEAPYRAIGQEPGWTLIIDERDLTFIPAGGQPIRQPRPQPIVGFAGEIYQTQRIGVNVVHAACTDVMSGQAYRDRVQVDVDGHRFEGCGGDLAAPSSLAGTNWHVEAVNGRPTPPQGDYHVQFEGNRVSAKFGCNGMSGGYTENGNILTIGPMAATRMFCPEPAMSFENQAGGILSHPVTVSSNGDRVTLSNANGRIALRRGY
ncbi:MAG TPA: META domain-containing protein [Sphingomicrobium sp.]|nr:META domain-containing protein [Sphingomicrobium sp.]